MAHEKNTRKKGGVGKILLVLVVLLALAVGGALLLDVYKRQPLPTRQQGS